MHRDEWCRDQRFIPLLLTLSVSPFVMTELQELLHHLQARRQRLHVHRVGRTMPVLRILQWRTCRVVLVAECPNSAEPVLKELA
ncbi:type VI secretion system baseplate subunit TssK [Escherichia coli]|nr:type VI secretion system baseplate subunit TssK [Escherichia coli]